MTWFPFHYGSSISHKVLQFDSHSTMAPVSATKSYSLIPIPPSFSGEVKQQHQVLQGKGETIKNLQTNIQGRQKVWLVCCGEKLDTCACLSELMSLSDQVSEDLEVIAAWRKEDTEEEEELQVSMVGKEDACEMV